ncbi:hypothetical protein IG631_18549 [Alternaria alternata]|jgi:hypothetical protein|nr:hypothetical protein IG631_18549 [Alternaria alternata]
MLRHSALDDRGGEEKERQTRSAVKCEAAQLDQPLHIPVQGLHGFPVVSTDHSPANINLLEIPDSEVLK